jgi:predicted RNase H-like HicB family nuclease
VKGKEEHPKDGGIVINLLKAGLYTLRVHNMYTYKIHLHKEAEGGFTVSVPVLPGCITYGEDVDEAIAMAKEAIELYIEELQERGEAIPDDSNTLEYSLSLEAV